MTDKELRELVARLDTRQMETERIVHQAVRQLIRLSEKLETPWYQDELKFPQEPEEPLEFPWYRSLREIMARYFQASMTSEYTTNLRLGISVSGYGYSNLEAYLGQYRGQLHHEDVDQMLQVLADAHEIFPETKGKQVYGILAIDDLSVDVRDRALREGIYLAIRREDLYELKLPEGFQPRAF